MPPLLDIIIPVYNEAENLVTLVDRLDQTFVKAKLKYHLYFVDDHSTDNSLTVLHELEKKFPLTLLLKQGKKGKAYSILEGSAASSAPYLAMIDADLQYPPEAIPEMLDIAKNKAVVVARRNNYQENKVRHLLSRGFEWFFGKVLHGLNCDVQSGLKVFSREIISYVTPNQVTAWTLDIPLLTTAVNLGYSIREVNITFEKRTAGKSKIHLLNSIKEIGGQAASYKLRHKKNLQIFPENKENMLGAGMYHKGKSFITHTTLKSEDSAVNVLTPSQRSFLIFLGTFLIGSLILNFFTSIKILVGILSFIYFADVFFNLYVILKSLHHPPEIIIDPKKIETLSDKDLPIYTVMCPLYKEAHVLPQFVDAIKKMEWPKNKLDVILLLEADDVSTIQSAREMKLPSFISIQVVPDSLPKTKPKACNYGLHFAKGTFLVIYDAEDIPDPLQLKKVYLAFLHAAPSLKCIQAKLNFYNPHQNLLTRFFTAEYSLWFDVVLTGLQGIETSIPLGGTSNHFRTQDLKELQGWDSFNVTEDADLGIRLFKRGGRTAIIDSVTLEEANSSWKNWLRQRSRWIKGYMQTYLVHMRNPYKFFKEYGWHALLFQLVMGGKISFMLINPFMWLLTISYFGLYAIVGPTIETFYPSLVFYMAATSLLLGNFLFLYYYMIGAAKREHWSIIKWVFLVPIYWLFVSLAAAIALHQLIVKPHYWEKTVHGLNIKKGVKKKNTWLSGMIVFSPRTFFNNHLKTPFNNFNDFIDLFKNIPKGKKSNKNVTFPRILIFNWRDTKHTWAGGSEEYIHQISKRLAKSGHKVTMFCGNDGKCARNEVVDGVQIVRRGGFYTVYLWAFLYYRLKFKDLFDIILDTENGIPFLTPLFIRKPIFLLVHHIHQNVFRKHLPFPLSFIASRIESRLMPILYKHKKVITVSESSKNDIMSLGIGKENGIEVINPGIEPALFYLGKKTDFPSIAYVGRLKAYKNLDLAIRAFANILPSLPDAKFFIAGVGEEDVQLHKLIKKLRIETSVVMLGKINDQEKAHLFSKSWLAIQPSMVEGWGITVIEANASGTPVIASNTQGLRDSIIHEHTGLLIKPYDEQAFSKAMLLLLRNKKMRSKLTKQAFIWASKFSWDESAKKIEKIILKELEMNFTANFQQSQELVVSTSLKYEKN